MPRTRLNVSGQLFDTNVWLAAVFASHPFHARAQQALRAASPGQPAHFCRSTEQSFLRLLTTPALLRAYGAEGLTNRDAIHTLRSLQSLPQVRWRDEPAGTLPRWHALAAVNTASPKVWMDAYLAAFAIAGSLSLLTLDRALQRYTKDGLVFELLASAPS